MAICILRIASMDEAQKAIEDLKLGRGKGMVLLKPKGGDFIVYKWRVIPNYT